MKCSFVCTRTFLASKKLRAYVNVSHVYFITKIKQTRNYKKTHILFYDSVNFGLDTVSFKESLLLQLCMRKRNQNCSSQSQY